MPVPETKPADRPSLPKANPKAPAGPSVQVRATANCYIGGVYYFVGDEFAIEEGAFNDQAMELVGAPKK